MLQAILALHIQLCGRTMPIDRCIGNIVCHKYHKLAACDTQMSNK